MAAWKWWNKQTNPDWLVEPTEPTEPVETTDAAERSSLNGSGGLSMVDPLDEDEGTSGLERVDGSVDAGLDPEVEAKQADADHPDDEEGRGGAHP